MAEERGDYCGGDFFELHDARDGDCRQRVDVPSNRSELRGNGDECSGDADSKDSDGSANDRHATDESDGDGRADGHFQRSSGGHGSAELSVAEERHGYHRCGLSQLHHSGDNNGG
jgi:hypothetical protein